MLSPSRTSLNLLSLALSFQLSFFLPPSSVHGFSWFVFGLLNPPKHPTTTLSGSLLEFREYLSLLGNIYPLKHPVKNHPFRKETNSINKTPNKPSINPLESLKEFGGSFVYVVWVFRAYYPLNTQSKPFYD